MINWKRCEKKQSWPTLRYYSSTSLKGLRKPKKSSVSGLRFKPGISQILSRNANTEPGHLVFKYLDTLFSMIKNRD
jgi:hypothetical protein